MAEALPLRMGRFLVAHPDIDLELQELPSDAVLQALRRGVADVGIVADYVDTRVRHHLTLFGRFDGTGQVKSMG